MRRKIVLITIFALTFVLPAEASVPVRSHREGTSSASQESRLEKAKNYGLQQVNKRLNSLTQAHNRAEQLMRISDEEKNAILKDLDESYAGLEALKPQIEAASDVDQLRSLLESVFYDYRVYAVWLPRERGLMAGGVAIYVLVNRSQTVIIRVEEVIENLESAGQDASTLKDLLERFKGEVEEAKSLVDQAKLNFLAMKPAKDVTEAKNYLDQGRSQLKDARDKAHEVRKTLVEIRDQIRALKSP